jgi:hypothetical protein
MNIRNWRRHKLAAGALAAALAGKPATLLACAACYGQSDSALARGMNWGILTLLGVVALVLGTLATFFVYLGKRAAASSDEVDPGRLAGPEKKV